MAKKLKTVPAYHMHTCHADRCAHTPSGRVLPLYRKECDHSEEFSWGYAGSGPAQLAYCLLRHHTGDRSRAWLFHQDFKRAVISQITLDTWEVGQAYLQRWIAPASVADYRISPIWVWPESVQLAAWLEAAHWSIRETISQMARDRVLSPLVDFLSETDCPLDSVAVAAELAEWARDGRVIV